MEYTSDGVRGPVANLRLKVIAGSPFDGAVGGTALPDVVTDSHGRYEISNYTAHILFLSTEPGSNHRFLCDGFPIIARYPYGDIPVVHVSWTDNRLPRGMFIPGTSVFGVVQERAGDTTQPVTDATVMLDQGIQDAPGRTNAAGFYMICSVVGTDQTRTITASKAGYRPVTRELFGGWDSKIDLELARE
jgi:hypothetical protein